MGAKRGFELTRAVLTAYIVTATLLVALVPAPSAAAGSCPDFRSRPSEVALGEAINVYRLAAGVGRLKLDPELSLIARRHTGRMARKSKLVHTPLARLGELVTRWTALGENIGWGPNVSSVLGDFKSSTFHRANLLGSTYRHFGIGITRNSKRVWTTIVFSGKRNPGTTLSC